MFTFWHLNCGTPVISDYFGTLCFITAFGKITPLKAKMRFSLLSFSLSKKACLLALTDMKMEWAADLNVFGPVV